MLSAMNDVANIVAEQRALLRAILSEGSGEAVLRYINADGQSGELARRGLEAYRSNGFALAERALAASYPVIEQLLGVENFAPMARHFWRQGPPVRGDITCWGSELPNFLQTASQLADEPFLADVARAEWAMHMSAHAQDFMSDIESFKLIASLGPENCTLTLGAGAFVLSSDYPVASIINSHLTGVPTLREVTDFLRDGTGECIAVWRQDYRPRVRRIPKAEHRLLWTLLSGLSLENALSAAIEIAEDFNFERWLLETYDAKLVTGVTPISSFSQRNQNPYE